MGSLFGPSIPDVPPPKEDDELEKENIRAWVALQKAREGRESLKRQSIFIPNT